MAKFVACYLSYQTIKTFSYIVRLLVALTLCIYIGLQVFLNTSNASLYMAEAVSSYLSERLGTSVSVKRIDIGLFNKIDIRDIHIKDQDSRPLLSAELLSVRISPLDLLQDKITIKHIGLYHASCSLRKATEKSIPNYQFVIDSLSSKPGTQGKTLEIQAKSIVLKHSDIRYDLASERLTPHQLNPSHLHFTSLNGSFSLSKQSDGSINMRVRNFQTKEKSGLVVKNLRLLAAITDKEIGISHLKLELPESSLDIKQTTLAISPTPKLKNGECAGRLSLPDFAFLYSGLRNTENRTYDIYCRADLLKETLHARLKLGSSDNKDLQVKVQALLPSYMKDRDIKRCKGIIENLSVNSAEISYLSSILGLKDNIREKLSAIGNIHHSGTFDIQQNILHIQGKTLTEAGDFEENIHLRDKHIVDGDIRFQNTDFYKLSGGRNTSSTAKSQGALSFKGDIAPLKLKIQGEAQKMAYAQYSLQNLSFTGDISPSVMTGNIRIEDPNLKMTISPQVKTGKEHSEFVFSSQIDAINPKGLRLTDKYGDATLSTQLTASYTAKNKSNKYGHILFRNFQISENGVSELHCDSLSLHYSSNGTRNKVSLNSDFAEARIQSECNLEEIPLVFLSFADRSFPSLRQLTHAKAIKQKNIDFSLSVKNSRLLSYLLKVPLQIDQPATAAGYLDPQSSQLNITSWLPKFTYDGVSYSDGTAYIKGNADSLQMLLQVSKMFDQTNVKIVCNTSICDNVLYPQIEWKTLNTHGTTGKLSAELHFPNTESADEEIATVHIKPSQFTIQDTLWTIKPSQIKLCKHGIHISPLELRQGNQYISIHNKGAHDSPFLVTLNGLEVSHILDLLNFHPVSFSGKIYGTASIPSRHEDSTAIPVSMVVENFHFQNGKMGTLHVDALMDSKFKRINLHALTGESENDSMRISGFVDIADNSLELNFTPRKTNAEFLNSWLKGVLGDISGRISGKLQLKGPLNALDFHGNITLDTLSFRPPVTNALYTISHDSISFEKGKIAFRDFRIRDTRHGSCVTTGNVTHQHLKHFGYDFHFDANNFHAYNWDDAGKDVYWGKVYADGHGRLHGTPSQVYADISLSPQTGSTFYYNNSNVESTSSSEFIRFHNGNQTEKKDSINNIKENGMEALRDNATDVYLNMTANTNPNLQFVILTDKKTGDGLYLKGQGPLNISWYNKGKFHLSGLYSTTGGEYHLTIQDLMRRNFKIQPDGYLRFTGEPGDGDLNLRGVYTVHSVSLSDLNLGQNLSNATTSVDCLLNFGGKANNPAVTFGLDFPTARDDMRQSIHSAISSQEDLNMQMLYLLTVGRFYTYDYENSTGSSTQNQSVLAMQSLFANTLGNSLGNVLSQVLNISNWSFGPNLSTGKMGWDDMEVGGQFQGSLLQNRIQLSGNFGYREQNTYANNFVGDFNLRWLLNPKGTISLKAYSETNDRYFSRSSLSTQGGGLQFQHNFNFLKELFGRRSAKKPKTTRNNK